MTSLQLYQHGKHDKLQPHQQSVVRSYHRSLHFRMAPQRKPILRVVPQ